MRKRWIKSGKHLRTSILAGIAIVAGAMLLPGSTVYASNSHYTWQNANSKNTVIVYSLHIDTSGSPCNRDGSLYPGAVMAGAEVPRLENGMTMTVEQTGFTALLHNAYDGSRVTANTRVEELTWYRSTAPVNTEGCTWEEYTKDTFTYSDTLSYRARIKVYAGKARKELNSSTAAYSLNLPVEFSSNIDMAIHFDVNGDDQNWPHRWYMAGKPVYDTAKMEYYAIFESEIFSGASGVTELSANNGAELEITNGTCSSAYAGDPVRCLTMETTKGPVCVDPDYSGNGFYKCDSNGNNMQKCKEGDTFEGNEFYCYQVKLIPTSRAYKIVSGYSLTVKDQYDADRIESFARKWTETSPGVYVSPVFSCCFKSNPWLDEDGNELEEITIEEKIKDEGLRRALKNRGAISSITGKLKRKDAEKVTSLILSGSESYPIKAFEGLGCFPGLTKLEIRGMGGEIYRLDLRSCLNLSSLEVSRYADITEIWPNENLLSMDISYNESITDVRFSWNLRDIKCPATGLTALDLSSLEELRNLQCNDCALTQIKLSDGAKLENLSCYNCHELTGLSLSNIQSVRNLSYYNCSSLGQIVLEGVEVGNLKISENEELTSVSLKGARIGGDFVFMPHLRINSNPKLTGINMQNTTIDRWSYLDFANNNLKALDLSTAAPSSNADEIEINTEGNSNMTTFKLSDQFATERDSTYFPWRTYTLNLSHCKLSTLTLPDNLYVDELNCSYNQLTQLDGKITLTGHLDCSNNKLTQLDVSKITSTGHLDCSNNQLTKLSLDTSDGKQKWGSLNCSNNQLTQLYISAPGLLRTGGELNCSSNPNLINITLYEEKLASLDASGCPKLQLVNLDYSYTNYHNPLNSYCRRINLNGCGITDISALMPGDISEVTRLDLGGNKMTALDVTAYTNIIELNCSNNQLSSLVLDGLTKLENLDCSGNELTTLNLSEHTAISALDVSRNKLISLDLSAQKALKTKYTYCGEQKPDTVTAVNWIVNLRRIDEDFNPERAQETSGDTILQNSERTAGGFKLPENTATLCYSYDVGLAAGTILMPVSMTVENSTGGKVYFHVNSKNAGFTSGVSVGMPEFGKTTAVRDVDGDGKIVREKEKYNNIEETRLPVPSWANHDFLGWYTDKTGGEEKTIDDTFEGETILFAHWENPHHLVYVEPKEATCEEEGHKGYYVCQDGGDNCGWLFEDAEANKRVWSYEMTEAKKDHITSNGSLIEVAASEPTCEQDGNAAHYKCKYCGRLFLHFNGTEEQTEEEVRKDKLGHDWSDFTVMKAATEEEEGIRRRTCKREGCGHFEEESIPKLAHVHDMQAVETVNATCIAYGVLAHYECKKCGDWFEDAQGTVPVTDKSTYLLAFSDHQWEVTEQKPTETEDGFRRRRCSVCEAEEKVILPKTDHEHQLAEVPAAESTCSVAGNKLHYKCTVEGCELLFEDAEGTTAVTPGEVALPKKAHDFEAFERTEYCEQTGYEKHFLCKNCGQWFDEMKQEAAETDLMIPAAGHNWSAWTETTPATDEAEGEITRVCQRDGSHVETQKIPKQNSLKVGDTIQTEEFIYRITETQPMTLTLIEYRNQGRKDVVIPNTVIYQDLECRVSDVAKDVFFDYAGMETLTVFGGVTIESGSFAYCTDLKSVKIQAGWESGIGAKAFEGCTSLESIVVEEGVTTIDQGAFKGCKALKTVILPGSINSIASDAFEEGLELAIYSDSAAVISYAASHGYGTQQHEHSWSKSWSSDETGHWHACMADGCDILLHIEMDGYAVHSFPETWSVRRKATEEKEGIEYRRCSVCRYEETKSIPKIVPKYYAIAVTAGQGGSISITGTKAADGKFKENTKAVVTATAAQGWRFVKWTKDGADISTSAEYTFTIAGDAALTAVFEKAAQTGGDPASGSGSSNPVSGSGTSAGGTSAGGSSTSGSGGNPVADGKQTDGGQAKAKVKVGDTFAAGDAQYKITGVSDGKLTVTYVKNKKKKAKSTTVPKTVSYGGNTYKVTEIAGSAFAKNTALTSVTVGANVKKIGASAFSGCKKLKKITIKTKVLTSVGKNALKGVHKNCVVKVPKAKLKDYTKLFKKKGQSASVKIKK